MICDTTRLIATALNEPGLNESNLNQNIDQYDYADVFRQHANIDVFAATIDELANCSEADTDLRQALGNDKDAWLDLILSTRIIHQFSASKLTVLRHYPASQAALARLCPGNERVADRFEVFLGPTELANGYVELTDAAQQLERINSDQAKRQQLGLTVRPFDRSLLASLEAGLPQCAGVAVGLERLQMMHDKTDDIGDVVTFLFENDNV
jgi:lysyl-tRNA synthetase class 2